MKNNTIIKKNNNEKPRVIVIKRKQYRAETTVLKEIYEPPTTPTILYNYLDKPKIITEFALIIHVQIYSLDTMLKCYLNEFEFYVAKRPFALSLLTKFVNFVEFYNVAHCLNFYQHLWPIAQQKVVKYAKSFEGYGIAKTDSKRQNTALLFKTYTEYQSPSFSPKEYEKYSINLLKPLPNQILKKKINSVLQKQFFAPGGIENGDLQFKIFELQSDIINLVQNKSGIKSTLYFERRNDYMFRDFLEKFYKSNCDQKLDSDIYKDLYESSKEYKQNLIINIDPSNHDIDHDAYLNKISDLIFNNLLNQSLLKKYLSVIIGNVNDFNNLKTKFKIDDFEFTAIIKQFFGTDYIRETRYYAEYRTFVTLEQSLIKLQRNFIRMNLPSKRQEWFELIRVRLPVEVNGVNAFDITLLDIIILHKKSNNAIETALLSKDKNCQTSLAFN